ncbi:MAG: 30S ribosome-binding factor RbfA [Bacillota bacterium]
MSQYRPERFRELLKTEISDIIQNSIKDPRVGFASITSVEVSNDLRHAKVYVSVLGTEQEKQDTLTALNRAAGFVRSEVGKRISLRHTPEILFRPDSSIEHGAHINAILRQLKETEGKRDDDAK